MPQNMTYYWENKAGRAERAKKHTEHMANTYAEQIELSVKRTIEYSPDFKSTSTKTVPSMEVIIDSLGSTEAISKYAEGKTAVLNFASYKEPGGGFIVGSRAQEECLCHDSFLYNVLSQKQAYYDWNLANKNKGMYLNRALYSPEVWFEYENKIFYCDVITCAAPNFSIGVKYGKITAEENTAALRSRIQFVLDIAKENEVDTLILGAFGCGVFMQDPIEVARIFMDCLRNTHKSFKKIVFAIPADVNQANYMAFYKTLSD